MRTLVMLGPPGAGKGTQAQHVARHLGVPTISTGDLFRAAATDESPLGRTVRAYMRSGQLVPDEVTNEMVEQRLGQPDVRDGFVLDGYPRNTDQARVLDTMLGRCGRRLDAVLALRADDEEIIQRLSGRRTCRACKATWHVSFHPPRREDVCDCGGELYQRDDDTEVTIKERLVTYYTHTAPLTDFYAASGRLVEVDAVGSVQDVTEAVLRALLQSLEPVPVRTGPGWPLTGGSAWFMCT